MKYIPIAGIGLAIWGLVTLDWFIIAFGVILFFVGFFVDLLKKKGAMKDDKVFSAYRTVSELIRIIRKSIEDSDIDLNSPKAKLAQGLFFMGMLDGASQSAGMDDEQFLSLFKTIFSDLDYDFDENYSSKILMFHQGLDTEHAAFPAVMKGGELITKFINGNTTAVLAGRMLLEEIISNDNFPESVNAL